MYAVLLNPLNNPLLMSDLNTGVVKFKDEKTAESEAKKYVNQYCTNKTYLVINLDNCVDLNS